MRTMWVPGRSTILWSGPRTGEPSIVTSAGGTVLSRSVPASGAPTAPTAGRDEGSRPPAASAAGAAGVARAGRAGSGVETTPVGSGEVVTAGSCFNSERAMLTPPRRPATTANAPMPHLAERATGAGDGGDGGAIQAGGG